MAEPLEIPIPPIRVAMWRSLKLGYRAEPVLIVVAFVTTVGAAVPDALFALGLKMLADKVSSGDDGGILVVAMVLACLATLTWGLKLFGDRANRRFADRSTVVIESHVARLQASVAGIEHHERPDYLDRLAILRDQVFTLNHLYASLFGTAGAVLRLGLTVAILVTVHPALALLAVMAVPNIYVTSWRAAAERKADDRAAHHIRLTRHLFLLGSTAPPGKELRTSGVAGRIVEERQKAWDRWYAIVAPTWWASAFWRTLAWALFGASYVAAVVFVAAGLDASAGEVLLVVAAGSRLSMYVGQTVREVGFLRGFWLDASRRLAWLEDYAAAAGERADLEAPDRLDEGIRLTNVSFRYPATDRLVLDDVDLLLPAGRVVALVGENGAGKTTLVKLLCRYYEPTTGTITVDGADLSRIPAEDWRARCAGAFQDFFRFELTALHSVGVGDLPRLDDRSSVKRAVDEAGAADVVDELVSGLDTQLGPSWKEGAELSFGQWQKLALARGFMREGPLLLVLDEPTAALDAETEHALFERYAASARAAREQGRITLLVSHRFSTVRMADLIVVLDGSHVAEVGSHQELMARNGHYAELYNIQAASYS